MIFFFLSYFFCKGFNIMLDDSFSKFFDNRYKLYLHKLSNLMVIQSKKIVKL